MSVSGERLEKRIREALRAKMTTTNRSENAEINEQLGIALNVKTNNQITDDVKLKFDTFIKQQDSTYLTIEKSYPTGGNPELLSKLVKPTKINADKQGYFRVLLSDNITAVYFRFESKDTSLRYELVQLLNNNDNRLIDLQLGAKHSGIGIVTRVEHDIEQMDENLIFDILVNIYNLLF